MAFYHMLLKTGMLFAGVVAPIAAKGILSSVIALVYFQSTSLSAGIVALVTLQRLLT